MQETEQNAVEIVGVVQPPGAGGGRAGTETLWTLSFSLQPWRRPNGQIEEGQLSVRQPGLLDERLRELMDALDSYAVLRLRVRLVDSQPETAGLRAELIELLGKDPSDAKLSVRAEELQKPVTVEDSYFGTVTLDRGLNWFETSAEWNSEAIQLCFSRDEGSDEAGLFRAGERLWEQQEQWDRRVRDFAAEELLDLKNDEWLDDDEEELTARQFKARMTLESIVVYPDGHFEFTFDDGGLFWGHVIQVGGTLSQGPTSANIAG